MTPPSLSACLHLSGVAPTIAVLTFYMKWQVQHDWQPSKMALTVRQGPQGNPFAGMGLRGGTRREGTDEDGNAAGTPGQSRAGLVFRHSLCCCSPHSRVAPGHLQAQGA